MGCLTAAAFLLSSLPAQQLAPAQNRALSADDILGVVWVSSPALSPHGKQVAYIVNEPLEAKATRRKNQLWKGPSDKSAPVHVAAPGHNSVSQPRWSPNGKRLAFLSSGADGKDPSQIHLITESEDGVRRLKTGGGVMTYRWVPTGQQISFTSFGRPVESDDTPEPLVVGSPGKRASLWTVSTADGKVRRITRGDVHVLDFAWSADGTQVAVTVAPSSEPEDIINGTSLRVIDGKSGNVVRTLNDRVGGGIPLTWSPDGKTIAFPLAAPKRIGRRLALTHATGGEPSFPLKDYRGTPNAVHWMEDSSALLVQTFEKTRNRLIRVDLRSGGVSRLAEAVHNFWGFSASADLRTLAVMAETPRSPPNLEILREGQPPTRLTNLNPDMSSFGLGGVRDLEWESSLDGRPIFGVLITPSGAEPGKPSPTIVHLHGGPHGGWWNGWIGTWLSVGQFLASHGYAVLLPNHRGSVGQGWEFAEAHHREWGRGDFQDVLDGVGLLVEKGIADPERLGVHGGSFGGYMGAWATTQTDRFCAAVIASAFTDLVSWNLTVDVPSPLRFYLGGDEIRHREFYRSRSPLTYVERCKTPTLILHGAKDVRVPLGQAQAWHRALKLLGVETEMVIYPDEGHGLGRRENQRDYMNRVLAWFDKYLAPRRN